MKRFFVYELKKSVFVIIALTIVATAVYLVALLSNMKWWFEMPGYLSLSVISSIGGVLAVAVPVWKLYYKMKKRSVDLYYSLPLSHSKVLAVKLLVGFVAVYAPYTLAYWTGAFTVMGAAKEAFNAVYYIPVYFASLIPMLILYTLSSFLYTRANKAIDGVLTVLAAGFAAAMLVTVLQSVVVNLSEKQVVFGYYFLPLAPLDYLTVDLEWRFLKNIRFLSDWRIANGDYFKTVNMIVGFTLTVLAAIAAGIALFITEKRAKAENVEQISGTLFGYKTMIPFYAFSIAYIVTEDSFVLGALVAAAAYALSVLYKRTPKIGRYTAIATSIAFILGAVLSFVVEL